MLLLLLLSYILIAFVRGDCIGAEAAANRIAFVHLLFFFYLLFFWLFFFEFFFLAIFFNNCMFREEKIGWEIWESGLGISNSVSVRRAPCIISSRAATIEPVFFGNESKLR